MKKAPPNRRLHRQGAFIMSGLIKRKGGWFYLKWYEGAKEKTRSLRTQNKQIAKEKLRQFESASLRGDDNPLPTQTPIGQVVQGYTEHIRRTKTPKSVQNDLYYLRGLFGADWPALRLRMRIIHLGFSHEDWYKIWEGRNATQIFTVSQIRLKPMVAMARPAVEYEAGEELWLRETLLRFGAGVGR
jgi:hypothetical protein